MEESIRKRPAKAQTFKARSIKYFRSIFIAFTDSSFNKEYCTIL